MSSSINPFVQDIERRQVRRPRSGCLAKCLPPCCTFLFGTIGLIVLIYVLALLNPLGFSEWNSSQRSLEPYDVSRPVRRWPATKSPTNGAERSVSSPSPANILNKIWTGPPYSYDFVTTELATTTLDPFISIEYPNVPPASMCIPRFMKQAEYEEKTVYCHQCWQNTNATGIRFYTFAKTDEEFTFKCHARCFGNPDFESCAIHLHAAHYPSASSFNCTYCRQDTRESLGLPSGNFRL